MNSVVALIVARNEEKHINEVISALKNQTHSLRKIILVDDGSIDNTSTIAKELGSIVISLPFHEKSLVGMPELAIRWNVGLNNLIKYSPDYILLLGGDHILPENYVENLLSKMTDRIIIASGRIIGEPYNETAPRGSGRLVNAKFWIGVTNMQYPISYGWESWLLFKAMQLGYETQCFRAITTKIERPTNIKKSFSPGKGMYAIGYHWVYVLFRSAITSLKSPEAGTKMFLGWLRPGDIDRLDIANYVNELQKKQLWNRFFQIIRQGGRR